MDVWMHGCMYVWIDEWMDVWMYGCMYVRSCMVLRGIV